MALGPRATPSSRRSSTSDHEPTGIDLRLLLPAVGAWSGAALALSGGRWLGLAVGLGVASGLFGVLRRSWTLVALGAALAGAGGVAGLWAGNLADSTPAVWARQGALVTVQARVTTDLRHWEASGNRPESAMLAISLQQVAARGEVWQGSMPGLVRASGSSVQQLDQPVGATITFTALSRAPEPGDRSVATLMLRGEVHVIAEAGPLDRLANRFRAGLRQALAHSPPEQAGLVPSLVVGDISALPAEVKEDFKTTGLTHLTAVSGTNLTLMLVFTLGAARQLGLRGWWLRLLGLTVAMAFIVVCRAEPSVLRAAAMGLIAMAATGVAHDRARGLRALCLAILLLVLIDPWLARSWGFALSVSATAGILWWAGPWQQAMRRWLPGWLAESLAVPLAAQLATQPIVTALSGAVSMVGLGANVAAGPFVGPVTILGLGAGLVSLVWPGLAGVIGWLAGWCVQPIVVVARFAAHAPAAAWSWPSSAAGLVLLGVSCLFCAQVLLPRVLPRRWLATGLAVLLVVAALRAPPQPGWPGDWAVVACDVGQGGAQLIRAGPRQAVLVDTGPEPAALSRCLESVGVQTIVLLVITHAHADHIGGLAGLAGVPVQLVVSGPDTIGRSTDLPDGLPAPVATRAGDTITAGSVRWTTLAAGPLTGSSASAVEESPGTPDSAAENDAGVVGMIDAGRLRVLVTGDLEIAGQRNLLRSQANIGADVLVVPHHGSPRQDPQFIAAVNPRIALIQVGERNDYGHPAASTLTMLRVSGAAIFRTDEQGGLAVTADASTVVTQRR